MVEERIIVDAFDTNSSKATIEEAVGRYSTGEETGKLMWATRPNKGAKFTLVDSSPVDGSIEIDFYKSPSGWHILITAIIFPKANRGDGPTVLVHALGIATAIKRLGWTPIKPDRYASVRAWCEYRFQMQEVGKKPPSYQEMASESDYKWRYLKKMYSELGYTGKKSDKK